MAVELGGWRGPFELLPLLLLQAFDLELGEIFLHHGLEEGRNVAPSIECQLDKGIKERRVGETIVLVLLRGSKFQ